jgi:hypothetical protein
MPEAACKASCVKAAHIYYESHEDCGAPPTPEADPEDPCLLDGVNPNTGEVLKEGQACFCYNQLNMHQCDCTIKYADCVGIWTESCTPQACADRRRLVELEAK